MDARFYIEWLKVELMDCGRDSYEDLIDYMMFKEYDDRKVAEAFERKHEIYHTAVTEYRKVYGRDGDHDYGEYV